MDAARVLLMMLLIANILWGLYRLLHPPSGFTPADASVAMLHKALRHLVRVCEEHLTKCPGDEKIKSMLDFCKQTLESELGAKGLLRMGQLEEKVLSLQAELNAMKDNKNG